MTDHRDTFHRPLQRHVQDTPSREHTPEGHTRDSLRHSKDLPGPPTHYRRILSRPSTDPPRLSAREAPSRDVLSGTRVEVQRTFRNPSRVTIQRLKGEPNSESVSRELHSETPPERVSRDTSRESQRNPKRHLHRRTQRPSRDTPRDIQGFPERVQRHRGESFQRCPETLSDTPKDTPLETYPETPKRYT